MVWKIVWSPRAISDLGDIARYIGRSSPLRAQRFCMNLIGHTENANRLPLKGRGVPEKQREALRELMFSPYRIAYEIQSEPGIIEIMTVWHSARGPLEL